VIARELRITKDDMALFAAASGDRSPLHTDPAFARRTAFGECIVYGGLETIAMLGALPDEQLALIRSVRSSFPGPVLPGEPLTVHLRSRSDRTEWELRLVGRGKVLARVVASTVGAAAPAAGDAEPGTEITGHFQPGPELDELERRFHVQRLDHAILEGIAWASNVVGTTIQDFDALCAAVAITGADGRRLGGVAALQRLVLRNYDDRTDRLLIDGTLSDEAGTPRCVGVIECFPFAPTPLPESAALSGDCVDPAAGEVVVIGASRGLGAALSLALLARGHVVHGIYSSSSQAADEVVRLAGPFARRLFLHRHDAGDEASTSEFAARLGPSIDGIVLCAAPPPLPMSLTGESAHVLADFVARSVALAAVPLASLVPLLTRRGWVLLASTPMSSDTARILPQLVTAKAALEGLSQWVAGVKPEAHVVVLRPPKMRTDLANTPAARASAIPPTDVAAEILDRLADGGLGPGVSVVELAPAQVGAPEWR
jgi:acyl dehydratase/NAD(P)-dependent dehydrogenase (short-subunit alcohol dehydrogenase family)